MHGSRLALLTLLALGLAVCAGLREAGRDLTSARSGESAGVVPAGEDAPSQLLAPWEEYEEDGWVSPDEETDDGPDSVRPDRADPMAVPDLTTWEGSRTSLRRWAEREIERAREARPGTPAAFRLGALLRLLRQIREAERQDARPPAPPTFPWPWPLEGRPPQRLDPYADTTIPRGGGLW